MAQLVGQSEHAVQIVLVVQQDIGVDQGARHVAAGALSHILVDVDPAAVQGPADDALVVRAQGSRAWYTVSLAWS